MASLVAARQELAALKVSTPRLIARVRGKALQRLASGPGQGAAGRRPGAWSSRGGLGAFLLALGAVLSTSLRR